jgi:hypothetical protein
MNDNRQVDENDVEKDIDILLCVLFVLLTSLIILAGLADCFWHLLF